MGFKVEAVVAPTQDEIDAVIRQALRRPDLGESMADMMAELERTSR